MSYINNLYQTPQNVLMGIPLHTQAFSIQTIQQIRERNFDAGTAARQSAFTIVLVNKGSGTYMADIDKYPITANTLYCANPGQMLLVTPGKDIDGYVLSFSQNFLCTYEDSNNFSVNGDIFYSFSKAMIIPITEEACTELNNLAGKMMQEFAGTSMGRNEILRGLLKIFLLYIHRQTEKSDKRQCDNPGNTSIVKKFFVLLEKNFIHWKMVADYARELSITSNYLNEIIKKVTGFSARYHIQQRVIIEAKRKAAYAEMTMKEVAYNLGFDDIYHFSKYFKNVSGMNFTEFKRSVAMQFSQGPGNLQYV